MSTRFQGLKLKVTMEITVKEELGADEFPTISPGLVADVKHLLVPALQDALDGKQINERLFIDGVHEVEVKL